MTDPSHRVALVTGAARGIGRAIALRLARDGWQVVSADRDPAPPGSSPGPAPGFSLGPSPGLLRHAEADVAEEAAVRALVEGIAAREGRLDALVCNAGFMVRKPLRDLALAEWQSVLATNLTSTFLLARAAEPLLRAARGAIVTIASTRAHQSEPDTESYSASKGGLLALTHALAVSLGPEVRANCVSPGWIDTKGGPPPDDTKGGPSPDDPRAPPEGLNRPAPHLRPEDHAQHPAGRVGQPADVAALVAWLVGPESGFVTGAEFVTDGGMTRRMIYLD